MTQISTSSAALRVHLTQTRAAGQSVALVPTMGALHEGHVSLIRAARERFDHVVVSIFVNPTQFAPGEDFDRYPRSFESDLAAAEAGGAQHIFAPDASDLYPDGFATTVAVDGITDTLCGHPTARGSAHFAGVATVVAKLFNIVQPDAAYFGQKDAQQLAVIRRMVRDLDFPVEVVGCPTVREPDGLALSSRNAYLTADQRVQASALYRSLTTIERLSDEGEHDASVLAAAGLNELAGMEVEYLELVCAETFSPVRKVSAPTLVALAVRCGSTRLIDNLTIAPKPADSGSLMLPSHQDKQLIPNPIH